MSLETAKKVLQIEAEAIQRLVPRLDAGFLQAIDLLMGCTGRVVVSGMGKSGIIGKKIAATLSSTGTPSLFLHPAEALHGDLGMLVAGDVVIALSYSGETQEILNLLAMVKRLNLRLIALTGGPSSTLGRAADLVLDVSVANEACSLGLAPTASTTAALAMGDALAIALAERRGFTAEDFAGLHPGGKLGKRLTPVSELMHRGERLPCVAPATPLPAVIYEMSRKGFGVTAVVDEGEKLLGIISDGDLRRLLEKHGAAAVQMCAGQIMNPHPHTIAPHQLAPVALHELERYRITCLLVTGPDQCLLGLVHLHDLWTTELM